MTKHHKGWATFIALCKEMKNEDKLSSLFDLLLTPQEKDSIAMRCLIIRELLKEEQTQRDIAKNLNVSIAKITRGSNELKRLPLSFLQYIKAKIL